MRSLPKGRVEGKIRVPGSKSAVIRALAVAGLAPGRSTIHGGALSEDVMAMIGVLEALGVPVDIGEDPWVVDGGRLRPPEGPLDCGESGLTARIAIALAATVEGEVTVTGRGRLLERPMSPLVDVLHAQRIEATASPGGTLPVTVNGRDGWWGGEITVPTETSTQFLSAVLIAAPTARYPVAIRVPDRAGALGYVDLTVFLMAVFGARPIETSGGYEVPDSGYRPASYTVPPDASSAVYPAVAAAITGGDVTLVGLARDDPQPDMAILGHLEAMGCRVVENETGVRVMGPDKLQPIDADLERSPDGALGLAIACVFSSGPCRLSGLGTLRHKESDRLSAMAKGLRRLGAEVETTTDSLVITPAVTPTPARVEAFGDHRVAMSLALAGLRIGGVEVDHPQVVSKTWPGFWEDMENLVRT
ncbi:MAG TPA: 3-phosphoshikimate 1-carboxyvinyltransferase [Acidimicrobiia bacterium]